jgi:hypothetical protein
MVGQHTEYDIHPDGQRFVLVTSGTQSRLIMAFDLIDPEP